jgi:hypothetical protein
MMQSLVVLLVTCFFGSFRGFVWMCDRGMPHCQLLVQEFRVFLNLKKTSTTTFNYTSHTRVVTMSTFNKDIAFTRRVLGKVEGDLKGGDNSVLEKQAA